MIESQLKEAVELAIERGWSLRKLADLASISNSQLSFWLNGHRSLTIDTAGKIADALGMKLTKAKIPKVE